MKKIRNFLDKHFIIIVTCLLVVTAILYHPSINSVVLYPYRQRLWQQLVESNDRPTAPSHAELWQFREFYSRGEISLSRYDTQTVSQTASKLLTLPPTFEPYLLFTSSKITSVEGLIDPLATSAVIDAPEFEHYQVLHSSNHHKLAVNTENNTALLVSINPIEDAAQANGFLSFDVREEEFQQAVANKQWLTITKIKLD